MSRCRSRYRGVGVWGHLALEAVEELAAGQVVQDHVQLAWLPSRV